MHVKELIDGFGLRLKLPQHWYSTDISDDFEDGELIECGDVIKIQVQSQEKIRIIVIDVNDGMSVVTKLGDGKAIGVKYLKNKDDFEYIGKPSELYF